jgi:hypothetical protein
MLEPRVRDLVCTDGTFGNGLGLEGRDVPAGVGERAGGHRRIGTGADHDGVDSKMSTSRTRFSNRRRASPFLT